MFSWNSLQGLLGNPTVLRSLCHGWDCISCSLPCLSREGEAEGRCYSWISMCCAACSPELKVTNLGVSHLHRWRCWVQEQGSCSPDKHISDTSWNHVWYFQVSVFITLLFHELLMENNICRVLQSALEHCILTDGQPTILAPSFFWKLT